MAMSELKTAADTASDLKIAAVECFRLKLPYKKPISFSSLTESTGQYVILRLALADGTEGIAESVCRPGHSGEDAVTVAYQLENFFKPLLLGADPLGHLALMEKLEKVRDCRAAKMLIDVALWDLRGKVFGQPVWRLLGGTDPKPVPLTWIAHGNTRDAMVAEARRVAEERGYRSMKLKTWKRSMADVEMVAEVRKALPEAVIYVDGNGRYTESEARTIMVHVQDYNVSFIEEPCDFADIHRQAAMAAFLPIALLGDQCCESLAQVHAHVRAGSVGAVSVKLRRTGITESLKIMALCEAAGLPVVIGTDSESRIGALVRMHLRSAVPSLEPWPTETHFFDKLADDTFAGEFRFADGTITPNDAPGFGAALDRRKIERYAF
ncbi:MAG: L-Ala-D/L-Glu epimerase [Alphaproteobacteria bacterium]|jgi:L-alanine-DL-glutamate epimerase-like enolase superfamily enzyme|nr:L-Ala-D/L-Glu epimerase [Alphaproteobacteria bacterium]